jgi:hypothetical protein
MKTEWLNLDRFVHAKPLLFFYVLTNLIGIFLYFLFDSNISNFAKWEGRGYYEFGDSIKYIFTAFPVFLLCLLINILWGIKALIDIFRRKNFHAFVAGVVIAALWVANLWVCSYLANAAIKNGFTD